jgi:hypothetical protein
MRAFHFRLAAIRAAEPVGSRRDASLVHAEGAEVRAGAASSRRRENGPALASEKRNQSILRALSVGSTEFDTMPAIVMLLLSCSPDMLLCRPVQAQPANYFSMAECEQALSSRLTAGIIGRCQTLDSSSSTAGWKITPDGDLVTFEMPRRREPAEVDRTATGSIERGTVPTTASEAAPQFAVVRVTRGVGSGAFTTDYLVPRQ